MRKAIILFIILFLISSSTATAARKISITSNKNTLSLNDEMIVSASASGFTNGEKIYIKGAFYKEGSSNYFGLTKFNNSWIKNSATSKSQKEVIIGEWDNLTIVKLDFDDSGFVGVGDYKFKLGFYYLTSSGNVSSVNWSTNYLGVSIDSEPSPTPKSEKTNSSSSTGYEAQASNSPTPTIYKKITVSGKIDSKSVKITDAKRDASSYAKIKPITEETENEDEVQVLGVNEKNYPHIFLFSGGVLLAVGGFLVVKRELKDRKII